MTQGKKIATSPSEPKRIGRTVPKPTGTVASVTNPLDLWYLCEKVNYALQNPKFRVDGRPMYQRVVTQLIRKDDAAFAYHFPYIGEVGYDMTQSPPAPVMSIKAPLRPSQFPLAHYQAIKRGYGERLRGLMGSDIDVQVVNELLSLSELENMLTPEMRQRAGAVKQVDDELLKKLTNRKGLFRIPDVIKLKNISLTGKAAFSQANLDTVIEIKFPNDSLKPDQARAYRKIAGEDEDNFRLLETHTCQTDDKRKREWIREAQKEPHYVPVQQTQQKSEVCLRPEVIAYPILEGRIAEELRRIQEYLAPAYAKHPPMSSGPELWPMPDPAIRLKQEQDMERARGKLGAILGAPFFAVGTSVIVAETAGATAVQTVVTAASGNTARQTLTSKVAGQTVSYGRWLKPVAIGGGSIALTGYATAATEISSLKQMQPLTRQFLDNPAQLTQDYIYWPD